MPKSSPTLPTSMPSRRPRIAKAARPLYDSLHLKPGADIRWHLRRNRGLSDAELRAAMTEEGPYDGLISDTTLARVRRILKIPCAPEASAPPPSPASPPAPSAALSTPPPRPPRAGHRTTSTTNPATHPPPFLEIHRQVFTPRRHSAPSSGASSASTATIPMRPTASPVPSAGSALRPGRRVASSSPNALTGPARPAIAP
jgi:hypothetical protein